MGKVTATQVATPQETTKKELPEAVQEALGDPASAVKEGPSGALGRRRLGAVRELMAHR